MGDIKVGKTINKMLTKRRLRKTKLVRVSEKAHSLLKFTAQEERMTISKLVDELVKTYIHKRLS